MIFSSRMFGELGPGLNLIALYKFEEFLLSGLDLIFSAFEVMAGFHITFSTEFNHAENFEWQ